MGLDATWALRDLCYLVFGVGSFAGVLYAILSSRRKESGDERERIARIDANVRETRNDVSEIKSDVRAVDRSLHEVTSRVAVLESNCKKAHDRLDRHSERLDELERGKS